LSIPKSADLILFFYWLYFLLFVSSLKVNGRFFMFSPEFS
jgi:hypothetical protein